MAIKHINIYDIDGTLVDSSHRYKTIVKNGKTTIDLEHWRKNDNEDMVALDTLLPLAEQYKNDLKNPEVYVILATARQCSKNDFNHTFIEKHLGMPNKFVYRAIGDTQGGADLKIKGCRFIKNLKQFKDATITFYEDNKDYLYEVSKALNAKPVFIKSNQGY